MTRNLYICFTDIAKSTITTRSLGNVPYANLKERHMQALQNILTIHRPTFNNLLGDGAIIIFEKLEDVLSFATDFKFCCGKTSSRTPTSIKVRISIALGPVIEEADGNVQGNAVNYAARLNSHADQESIIICNETAKSIKTTFGEVSANFLKEETAEVKDFDTQQIFRLDAMAFVRNASKLSLHSRAEKYLENLGVAFSNVKLIDLVNPKSIIWPVVPRPYVNLIHKGMLEILFLFSLLGWDIKILIADYVNTLGRGEASDITATNFETNLKQIFSTKDVPVEIVRISSFFSTATESCCDITKHILFNYISPLEIKELMAFFNKRYSSEDREISVSKPSWNLLRPFFTLAASLHMCSKIPNGKNLILSGYDELQMWEKCTSRTEYEKSIGSVHLPMLNENDEYQFNQNTNDLYWKSAKSLEDAMTSNNHIAKWTLTMLLAIAAFPAESVSITANMTPQPIDETILFQNTSPVPDSLLHPLAKSIFDTYFSN